MHKSSVVLCLSKPSTSIYLDFCPRDQCFKVAYIVEDCNVTVNAECGAPSSKAPSSAEADSPVALREVSSSTLEPLLDRDQHTEEEEGTTFRGFIRVHLNLSRAISVQEHPEGSDVDSDLPHAVDATLTSFYLPRDTVKALHITSDTTTNEVIVILLNKFRVVDNPRKFALYERCLEAGETVKVKMRRLADGERPLCLALRWNQQQETTKMFVLQENETGDILWEAFSLPELGNFLRILDREEEEYKKVVRHKYACLGRKLQDALAKFPTPVTPVTPLNHVNPINPVTNTLQPDQHQGHDDTSSRLQQS